MAVETRAFEAEVGKLLDIVANALYSQKEIFLRELISNAADACDKLRHESLTQPNLIDNDAGFQIRIASNAKERTLTISDNGIGMDREELISNLGTIARSGTASFVEQLTQAVPAAKTKKGKSPRADVSQIGQFGVGFYSSFMVSDTVEVTSRKAGQTQAWMWRSDGKGEFTVEEVDSLLSGREGRGTDIRLTLRKEHKEFLEDTRLRHIIKTYSDHIAQPIFLSEVGGKSNDDAAVNKATALWTRPKSEVTAEQYREFFNDVGHTFGDPWVTLHFRAEGRIEYTALLFVPSNQPFDLFSTERKAKVKLYVRRVFITEDCEDLLPPYLRFMRGIVDSEDISLNISREMLQHDPVIGRIRKALVKRIFTELGRKAEKEPDAYKAFWTNFGAVLKEGLYEDPEQRETILGLARFNGTFTDDLVSLNSYVERMKPGQDAIYYIPGDSMEAVSNSPQLEGFRARGIEVLFMTDPVDEFWSTSVELYKEKPFRSVTRGQAELSNIPLSSDDNEKIDENEAQPDLAPLIEQIKSALEGRIKDVRISQRLTDSPVCLVADEGDIDMHLQRILKQHQRLDAISTKVLEINGKHALVRRLAEAAVGDGDKSAVDETVRLLLDQACIVEGEPLADPSEFARRLTAAMERGLIV
ncbi:MAG: molecular chaperone HtpG [Rhodospirillales bacterium]|jgi:molecular chaperone HtpG